MNFFRDTFRADREYFSECRASISAHNDHMLRDGCILYSLVLTFYTVLSLLTEQPELLRTMYYIFDAVHLALCAAVFMRTARLKKSFIATQLFCTALELSILSFFALEGALVSPESPSLYVPIAILLIQLLFIHRAASSLLMIFLYTLVFALLSYFNKIPHAYTQDMYIAMASLVSASIGYILVAKLRRNEHLATAKYEVLSRTDVLTGLLNKAALEKYCREQIYAGSEVCALIMIDLDDFKSINDKYGHDVGDEVLRGVGGAIRGIFRASDAAGRFGGDEFLIIMKGCAAQSAAMERAEALSQSLSGLSFSVPGLAVRASSGIAIKAPGEDFRSVFARADKALYSTKRSGKDRRAERP